MTLRAAVALAVCALALLALPWIIGNEFYVNMATQVLIYALFALSSNMMLGYGGMGSLGHAGYLGIAGYACILAVTAGYDHLTAAIFAIAVSTAAAAFFGLLSLRAPGLGFIYNFGIALVPDLAYFVLFLPMVLVLVFLPQGLFGRVQL